MANNIYIGARYVPLFDGEYNSEKVYEALTVVTYNQSSYTSKKPVPAGILPTNTEYWALTGNFNAQYNELSERITNAQDTADSAATTATAAGTAAAAAQTAAEDAQTAAEAAQTAAEAAQAAADKQYKVNRNVIFIGDSYGDQPGEWIDRVLSVVTFNHAYKISRGSHGFTGKDGAQSGETGAHLRWITDITEWAEANPTLVDTIDDIYIVGGFNDIYSDYATIRSYISEFMSYVRNTFNCRTHIGVCAWAGAALNTTTPNLTDISGEFRFRIANVVSRAYASCGEYGAAFIGNLSLCLRNYNTDFDSTNYHPSPAGTLKIADAMISYIMGGTIHNYIEETPEIFNDGSYDATIFWASMRDNVIQIGQTLSNSIDFMTSAAMNVGQAFETPYTYKSGIVLGKARGYGNNMIPCHISDANSVYEGVIEISANNKLLIISYHPIPAGTQIRVRINTATLVSEYC